MRFNAAARCNTRGTCASAQICRFSTVAAQWSIIARQCTEQTMKRAARDTSWHAVAFAVVVVGLSILAPLAWYGEHSHSSHKRSLTRRHRTAVGRNANLAAE